jgi:hypothetical protein
MKASSMRKKFIFILILLLATVALTGNAQSTYGKTLNLGLGVGGYSGYYKYAGRSVPVFHLNYEFDVAKDFTLAPFISFYTYSNEYYWGNNNSPDQYYTYNETVIPIGIKGTYYFDELLKANNKWDFYLGASLGFALVNASWEAGYQGDDKYFNKKGNSVFLDLHIGAEYHFNNRLGAFLDLSSGVSTIGLAIHGK